VNPQWKVSKEASVTLLWPRFLFLSGLHRPSAFKFFPFKPSGQHRIEFLFANVPAITIIDKLPEFVWVRSRKARGESTENFLFGEHHFSFLSWKAIHRDSRTHKRYRVPVVLSSLCLAFSTANLAASGRA
jgi:hypothetical protein